MDNHKDDRRGNHAEQERTSLMTTRATELTLCHCRRERAKPNRSTIGRSRNFATTEDSFEGRLQIHLPVEKVKAQTREGTVVETRNLVKMINN